MEKVVSITSQGQLTIPQAFLRSLGIVGPVKAVIQQKGNTFEVRPHGDFWSLASSLKSETILTDEQLKQARKEFGTSWGNE